MDSFFHGYTGRIIRCSTEDSFMAIESDRSPRDPEDREIDENNPTERKDKMMDKTVADTFPASDPPSSLPDPDDDSFAASGA
jgi:hypothetical protein